MSNSKENLKQNTTSDYNQKVHDNIPHEYRCKNSFKKLSNGIQQYIKIITYHDQVEFIAGLILSWFSILKIGVIYHINRLKKKNYVIILYDFITVIFLK